jgi:DNA-binding transcriptional MerR regulator
VKQPDRPDRRSVDLAAAAGISYRQLDYWIRHGWITLDDNGAGSGTRRNPTEAEWHATIDVARQLADLDRQYEEIRSGRYFTERRHVHELAPFEQVVAESGRELLDLQHRLCVNFRDHQASEHLDQASRTVAVRCACGWVKAEPIPAGIPWPLIPSGIRPKLAAAHQQHVLDV